MPLRPRRTGGGHSFERFSIRKDARVSPVSFNMQKERYFPVPVKEAVGVKDTPATSAKNSRGAAKVVLDKDFKMRVRRVVDTQTHVPGRGMGSMTVLNVTASAEYDAYVRSLHNMQTKSLSKTLRRLLEECLRRCCRSSERRGIRIHA